MILTGDLIEELSQRFGTVLSKGLILILDPQ
jgi:hypothetical protein